jgi:serine/threonine protein kinase/Tfp pilus assembly protein PilF
MVGKRVAHYQILEKLGQGGMGEVFLAEDTELHRKVALKFLPSSISPDEDALERFKQEARSSAALNHPHITTIYEVGVFEDRPYIAMAYIEGEKLTDVIQSGVLERERALDIAIQICAGLGKAHEAGIVHRDVKPDNILIDRDGRVNILDFGVAKLRGENRLPSEISTVGTAFYMSPEQINGGDVDARSDIFSLGVVLYEMVGGCRPFKGEHTSAVFYSITNEEPSPLPPRGLKPIERATLERIIFKALEKDPAKRYQSVQLLETDLKRFRTAGRRATPVTPKRLAALAAPVVVAVVAAALFILKPFQLEIDRSGQVVAAENSLAVMYFENLVDPEDSQRLGEIVTNLMITDLSESSYLSVVSSQRLYDLLKKEGREDAKVIDRNTATAIATQAGAKWMLQGNILQVEPNFVLTSQLVDVANGNVVASQRISGEPGETVFQMVDRLSDEARADLSVPRSGQESERTHVADVTTHSVEAYRAYLIGVEKQNKFFMNEAREYFERAVQLDSTFAMAYLRLADSRVSGTYAEKKKALGKAVEFADHASKKEMILIRSEAAAFDGDVASAISGYETITELYPREKQAYIRLGQLYRDSLGDLDKAREAFEKVIDIDPLDKNAYNQLAYLYNFTGEFEKSIWAINQYISLARDEPNPYDSRADLYAYNGKIDEAIQSYEKAVEMKSDFFPSILKLGHLAALSGDFEAATGYYERVALDVDQDVSRMGRLCVARIPLFSGDFKAAIDALGREIDRDREAGYEGGAYLTTLYTLADVLAEAGARERALEAAEEYRREYRRLRPAEDEWWRLNYGFLLFHCGETTAAEEMLGEFVANIDSLNETKMMGYATLKGLLRLRRGDPDAACSYLERATRNMKNFSRQYWLGRAYLEADRQEEALAVFDDMLTRYTENRAEWPILAVKALYYAGVASERTGHASQARARYERFLDFWGNADPVEAEVLDARSRLQALSRNI